MSTVDPSVIVQIPVNDIYGDSTFNCRGAFSATEVADLIQNIKAMGQLQPIIVKKINPAHPKAEQFRYIIIAGHRRHKAFQVLFSDDPVKFGSVQCIIKNDISDIDAAVLNLTENTKRKDLTIMQEANGIKHLLLFNLSRIDVAKKIGVAPSWVEIREMALELPSDIQNAISAGVIKQTHIRKLHRLMIRGHKDDMYAMARDIQDGKKVNNVISKQTPHTKRVRTRAEIFKMQEHISDTFHSPATLAGKVLAWCAGEVTDYDVYGKISEQCDSQGINYVIPTVSINHLMED